MTQIGQPIYIPLRVAEPIPAPDIVVTPLEKPHPDQMPLPLYAPEPELVPARVGR